MIDVSFCAKNEDVTDNLASVLIMAEETLKKLYMKASSASHVHRCALLMKESLFLEKVAIVL